MGNQVAGKRVLVVGCAISGVAVARYLVRRGAEVTITDLRTAAELKTFKAQIDDLPIRWELGEHRDHTFSEADLIVVSAGVPADLAPLEGARARGQAITTEVDLAFGEIEEPVIAITGSAGKSATAAVLEELLRAAGKTTFIGGSMGIPMIQYVLDGKKADFVIAELASDQLHWLKNPTPRVAVFTNIDARDALESSLYPRLMELCDYRTQIIMNLESPPLARLSPKAQGKVLWFAKKKPEQLLGPLLEDFRGIYHDSETGGLSLSVTGAGSESYAFRSMTPHAMENFMAAILAARALGVDSTALQSGIDELTERLSRPSENARADSQEA